MKHLEEIFRLLPEHYPGRLLKISTPSDDYAWSRRQSSMSDGQWRAVAKAPSVLQVLLCAAKQSSNQGAARGGGPSRLSLELQCTAMRMYGSF